MDSKKSLQDSDPWNSHVEQEIFGNQPPFAASSNTYPDSKAEQEVFGHQAPYAANVEQEVFGNQPPFAAGSSTLPDPPQDHLLQRKYQDEGEEEAPYLAHPYQPHMIPPQKAIHPTAPSTGTDAFSANNFPSEAPPMYSSEPSTVPPVTHTIAAPLARPQSQQSPQEDDHSTPFPLQSPEISPRTMRSLPSLQQPAPQSPNLPTDHASASYPNHPPLQQQHYRQQQQQQPYQYSPQSYGAVSPQVPAVPRQSRSLRRQDSSSSTYSSGGSDYDGSEDNELLSGRQRKNKYPIRCKNGKSRCSKRNIFLVFLTGMLIYYCLFVLMEDPCETAKKLETEEENYSFMYTENTTISLSILDGIPGNILVRENDDWGDRVVWINVFSTSADHNVIDDISLDFNLFPYVDAVKWTTHLQPGKGSPEKLLRRIKRTCTRSDTVITLPKDNKGVRSISLVTTQGDIRVQWENSQTTSEETSIHATNGSVVLNGLNTKRKTDIVVSGVGSVSGIVSTTDQVIVSTDAGHIDLELDTDVGLVGDPQKNLDVSLSTKIKGHINLVHTRNYSGYFALNSGLGDAVLMYPQNSSTPVFTKKSNAHIEGWITEDGSEPGSDIPVVKASTYEGSINMAILDSSMPRGHALEKLEPKD